VEAAYRKKFSLEGHSFHMEEAPEKLSTMNTLLSNRKPHGEEKKRAWDEHS